jgi:hypothetical protein
MSSTILKCLAAMAVVTLSGCTPPTTPNLDSRFGYAVNAAKAQQTLNPDASRNADPVAGLGGQPSKDSIDRYHNTFKEPPSTFSIGSGAQQ